MDNAEASCIVEAPSVHPDQQQSGQPPKLDAPDSPVSPIAKSECSDTNVTMATVPEESVDEIWSDAQEGIEVEERAEAERRDTEGTDGAFHGRAGTRAALNQLEQPDMDKFKIVTQVNKSPSEVIAVEEPPSSLPSPIETTSDRTQAVTTIPPSLHLSSAPSSPTATASAQAGVPSPEAPSSTVAASASARPVSPSPTQSSHGLERRQSRRRSTVDNRAANRFSSLLSNLIHRRPDRDLPSASSSRPSIREEELSQSKGDESSRASSPSRMNRTITPPPSLPPPSLQELGLSLTSVTPILATSHFSTPPTSGTFLKPHYLLLCHTQGLDILPLVAPPSPQPYALVRRVSFKSVVVMEEKGVLVAIAGRRDGVRVYALEEVRKAVEWRMGVESRREKDRLRREEARKGTNSSVDRVFGDLKVSASLSEKSNRSGLTDSPTTPTPPTPKPKRRKPSVGAAVSAGSAPPRPRAPTVGRRLRRASSRDVQTSSQNSDPPPYQSSATARPDMQNRSSVISVTQTRSRSGSVQNVLAGNSVRRRSAASAPRDDEKGDWEHHSSDDEAINMATAGPSGSAALDERTSSMGAGNSSNGHSGRTPDAAQTPTPLDIPRLAESRRHSQVSTSPTVTRRGRPAQLDVALSRTATTTSNGARPPPSPTPSVWTLRQALSATPPEENLSRDAASDADGDEDDEDGDGDGEPISFAQALMESRLPDLPPPGSQRPQEAIFITPQYPLEPQSPRETASETHGEGETISNQVSRRARRRWSVLDGVFSNSTTSESTRTGARSNAAPTRPRTAAQQDNDRPSNTLTRINSAEAAPLLRHNSLRGHGSISSLQRPSTSRSLPPAPSPSPSAPSTLSHHRFLPRIITSAFQSRRSDDQPSPASRSFASESTKRGNPAPLPSAPKLEYVKLPGTKGAVMIKAVETAKKSFLAILCGENGEKVELFAGTYRTTLGLSRTFILPDSPRSLELQLQGDDLVEVFLVFAQNVFGLEPATVRVREVRVGRAARRAARRRARENRTDELASTEANAPTLGEGDSTDANVSVGVTLTTSVTSQTLDETMSTPPAISRQASESNLVGSESTQQAPANTSHSEELAALATAQSAPYTTFQQLSFAPQFPLATIADECVIPPTYQSFLEYRAQYEPEPDGVNNLDLANVQFSPPGLPIPPSLPPSKWYYRDPKGVVQGPWKASLMQTWYKDGLLPPDLPVRREEDQDYILLKDLRSQSVDPTHPFRPPPPPLKSFSLPAEPVKPLLDPISLLTQDRRYGPPALFFTSRGGHSTSVVDARGRSVLRGRLHWSIDEEEDLSVYGNRLGDVKRLEPFDVGKTTVVAAVRQGGLEVTDVVDALTTPGDFSRPVLPNFKLHPSAISRRGPFVWRVGSPLSAFAVGPVSSDKSLSAASTGKKQGLGLGKSSSVKNDSALGNADDYEGHQHEELLYLGRVADTVYFCERSNGSFRILRLCPFST
ncbi:hypothetical protein ACEPAF_3413 [Sanghuangporus sanghuang]